LLSIGKKYQQKRDALKLEAQKAEKEECTFNPVLVTKITE
jgi:hypothetical protein